MLRRLVRRLLMCLLRRGLRLNRDVHRRLLPLLMRLMRGLLM